MLPADSVHIGAGAIVRVRPARGYIVKYYRDVPWRSAATCRASALWALEALRASRHIAKVLRVTRNCIATTYCGQRLVHANLPPDAGAQVEELLEELAAADVLHRDIVPGNILVYEGVIKLIDFAWATRLSAPEPIPADAPPLGGLHTAPGGNSVFDDRYSLMRIMSEI